MFLRRLMMSIKTRKADGSGGICPQCGSDNTNQIDYLTCEDCSNIVWAQNQCYNCGHIYEENFTCQCDEVGEEDCQHPEEHIWYDFCSACSEYTYKICGICDAQLGCINPDCELPDPDDQQEKNICPDCGETLISYSVECPAASCGNLNEGKYCHNCDELMITCECGEVISLEN